MDIPKIQARLKEFALERDWDQYHSPKNLSMALSVEASELMEVLTLGRRVLLREHRI